MSIIGLLQIDGKLPNLALMKISTYYKSHGAKVEFIKLDIPTGRSSKKKYMEAKSEFAKLQKNYTRIFTSVLYSWNRESTLELCGEYDNVEIGGTGYDLKKTLPIEIENCRPDYNLYTPEMIYEKIKHGIRKAETTKKKALEITNMGTGFTSRGCVRNCGFCVVPQKEGKFRQENSISEIINPRSNIITMYDNNLTADPYCIDKLQEIRDRKLIVDNSQGVDIRFITDEIAQGLSEVRHMRSIHYAWDLLEYETPVLKGIRILSQYIKPYRQMCFVLVGYNTTHEQDMYRVRKLAEMGIVPYVMKYNNRADDIYLNHFARWINGHFYKKYTFEEYTPWKKNKPGIWVMDNLFKAI